MAIEDPFATEPAADEAQSTPAPSSDGPWDGPVTANNTQTQVDDSEKVRITLKSGRDYDAPWLTADFPSIDVAHQRLSDNGRKKKLVEIFDVVAAASAKFQELVGGSAPAPQQSSGGGGQQRQSRTPQGAKEPPSWFPAPPAPGWVYKTGVNQNTGNVWHAWAPPNKGDGEWEFHRPPRNN